MSIVLGLRLHNESESCPSHHIPSYDFPLRTVCMPSTATYSAFTQTGLYDEEKKIEDERLEIFSP